MRGAPGLASVVIGRSQASYSIGGARKSRAAFLCRACIIGAATSAVWIAPEPLAAQDGDQAYWIEARLDPETHTIDGSERIQWQNTSSVAATDLVLHLYLNAFQSRDTVFMRESRGALRGIAAAGRGGIELLELRVGEDDLLPSAERELVPADRTQLRAVLASPVAPGASIEIRVRFRSTLPPVAARAGYAGRFHMASQWFPKLARRESDGRWASFPYHGRGEFYSDFARYELTLTTPGNFEVGASGELVERVEQSGSVRRRFLADPVHDVAFCAWDEFRERTERVGDVLVRVLFPTGYEDAVDRHLTIVEAGLSRYGALFGPYPYRVLTVVVPPRAARGAHAMEYPMLFTTWGRWWTVPGVHAFVQDDVTAHELAHQWFQGVIASHEVEWPMLDEGLAEWAATDLLASLYGERGSAGTIGGLSVSYFEALRVYALEEGRPPLPPGMPAYAYSGDLDLGRAVYVQAAIALETIARVWGRARLEHALGVYAREQRFRHPVADDLFRAFDATYGSGFANRWLRPMLLDGELADARLERLDARADARGYDVSVKAQRLGGLAPPTWIAVRNDDGVVERLRWPEGARRAELHFRSPHRPVAAWLDPDRAVLLDSRVSDNGWSDEPTGWFASLRAWIVPLLQSLLQLVGP